MRYLLFQEMDTDNAWVERFCDLAEKDGNTELSRLEAFAKLHDYRRDALKAARGLK